MNRKGQALVEFILILPVFLLILLTIVDFGNLLNSKNKLENTSTDIARLIRSGENIDDIQKIYPEKTIKITDDKNQYKKIEVQEKVKIMTPFLDKVLGNPCLIKTERVIVVKEHDNEG